MQHERFHYKSLAEVQAKAEELGVSLPFANDTLILAQPLSIQGFTLPNRMGVAPMEGADSAPDGSPSNFTQRRYVKEAIGGSAILWYEAISIVEEGRSSQTQLLLTKENAEAFRRMNDAVKEAGMKANGFAPLLIMQANHSGRYSNPANRPAPMIAYRHPELERYRAADDGCIVSDDYLQNLEERFGQAARLARTAGFDAIDIKCCHGYLLAELLSGFKRPGRYGGSFENRCRLLKNAIRAAKAEAGPGFFVTSRLGLYDGYAWPYGFGVSEKGGLQVDLSEPVRLVGELYRDEGLRFLNLTMGNPYVTTHVTRPFDAGKYTPEEHPFQGLARMIQSIGIIKRTVREMTVLASAPSYLRQFADLYASGAVEQGLCDGMLFGRMAFANPNFANEIIRTGRIDPKSVCLTCGKCGDLIRSHKPTGCVVRDAKTFLPFYKAFLEEKKDLPANFRG